MADSQESRAALVMMLRAHGVRDLRVLNAFERMPRQNFVPKELLEVAHRDSPLPLPCGQTMEKPSLAAQMVEAMQIEPGHAVLEIGAGSGWLTGVLSGLAREVTSYERYGELVKLAHNNLHRLGVHNVKLVQGDGVSANDHAAYDRIFLNASVETPPPELASRLNEDGLLFTAIGPEKGPQQFTVFSKSRQGLSGKALFPVRMAGLQKGMAQAL